MKKILRFLFFALLSLTLTAGVAMFLIVKLALAPASGEWSTRVDLGPMDAEIGVPTALRLLTSPWVAQRLSGRTFDTRAGPVRFVWDDGAQSLELSCTLCSVAMTPLGPRPLRFDGVFVTVRRDGNLLSGRIHAIPLSGTVPAPVPFTAAWSGRLSQQNVQLHIDAADAPVAQWYAVLAPQISELMHARIGGTMAFAADVNLPEGSFALQPRLSQFTVSGLGSDALLRARPACGAPAQLAADSWLARAVMAAEDPRFLTHPGYELGELAMSSDIAARNGPAAQQTGGTLTQQLARRLTQGDRRSSEGRLRELLYAVDMEQSLGKPRILQSYLDNAPWGAGVCGAEAAARLYFKRSARALEPAQAVWLAAMLHDPDAELARWRQTGVPNAARTKWVAEGVRGLSRIQRDGLLKNVSTARFTAP
ncbi:MAG: biosynthetic peptidoglycan transglycosylase [Pseudomonadota bacterium]